MFRFSIRDVLWLTLVAAVASCWYGDRMSMAKLQRKLRLTETSRQRSQKMADNASRMFDVINAAHNKEVTRLNERIYRLEGPGYGDKVEPTEVGGMGVAWWADRAEFFEMKLRESEHTALEAKQDRPGDKAKEEKGAKESK